MSPVATRHVASERGDGVAPSSHPFPQSSFRVGKLAIPGAQLANLRILTFFLLYIWRIFDFAFQLSTVKKFLIFAPSINLPHNGLGSHHLLKIDSAIINEGRGCKQ